MIRYVSTQELPAEASLEHIDAIVIAIESRNYRIVGTAKRYVVNAWEMKTSVFAAAIQEHIESGCRVFQKTIQPKPEDTLFFQANVRRDPESEDEEEDVYVEIRLKEGTMVIICDAHNHYRGKPRLPK